MRTSDQLITFKPEKTYQVILINLDEYENLSIQKKFTDKQVASLDVVSQPNGEFEKLDMIMVFELDSISNHIDFSDNKGVNFCNSTFLQVEQPTKFLLKADKYYEFFAAWLKPNKESFLHEFFTASEPIKQSYGRSAPIIKAQFKTLDPPSIDNSFSPHISGFVEWDRYEDVDILLNNPEFANIVTPLFEQAIDRMEMILGKNTHLFKS